MQDSIRFCAQTGLVLDALSYRLITPIHGHKSWTLGQLLAYSQIQGMKSRSHFAVSGDNLSNRGSSQRLFLAAQISYDCE